MSPQLAKVVGRLLVKNMQEYEQKVGKINLPPDILKEMGISEEGDA